jgi:hypothetical protein
MFLQNFLTVLVQIANKIGLQKDRDIDERTREGMKEMMKMNEGKGRSEEWT